MLTSHLTEKVLAKLKDWAKFTHHSIGTDGIYVFGSLIRRGGVQFDGRSDIDLIIEIPSTKKTPWERVEWMTKLHSCKQTLELDLMRLLARTDAGESISSVVVVSRLDIEANVHKDGAVGFFSENLFLDILKDIEYEGLPAVGSEQPPRLVVECLKFSQKKRNAFLAVSPNGSEKMVDFNEADPLPKDIMRYAAMARQLEKPSTIVGADTDTQRGLDYLTHHLYEFETLNDAYQMLHNTVSVRRGARGGTAIISPLQQLLLTEIVVDAALRFYAKEVLARTKIKESIDSSLPSFKESDSTVFFSERFAQAFPGIRGVEWFDDPAEIKARISRLLKEPLEFKETTPIWWWRNSNLQIAKFADLGNGDYLMNTDELRIKKIAAVHGGQYYRSFVYVEVTPMEPTGLYTKTPERILASKSSDDAFGYYWEEYGLVDGAHLVTRAEYDDGAAKIEGEIQEISGRSELRCRYVTPYNFIIAAHNSPINNPQFDQTLEDFLNKILVGKATVEELAEATKKLPKRNDD